MVGCGYNGLRSGYPAFCSRTLCIQTTRPNTILHQLLSDVVKRVSEAADQRQIDIVLEDRSALRSIEADQLLLGKVFRHRLIYAIRYTPNGG